MPAKARHPCPICGREAPPRGEARAGKPPDDASLPSCFPFCSPACKLVDLGRWLDGKYRVPGPPEESSRDGDHPDRDDE
jgi:endogenous inhibitor of DNA gyrase (YacG/DUF329 family)